MGPDAEIRGLDDFARLARALRAAGESGKGMRRELYRSLNRETKDVRAQMRAAILPALPKHGGLAADVQRTTRFTTTANAKGIRIRARGKRAIGRMDRTGTFRHPVFANSSKARNDWTWVTQSAGVEKGFLDKPFEEARPELKRSVLSAIDRIRADIYRRI